MEQAGEASVVSDWSAEGTATAAATAEEQAWVLAGRDLEVLESVPVDSRATRSQSQRK